MSWTQFGYNEKNDGHVPMQLRGNAGETIWSKKITDTDEDDECIRALPLMDSDGNIYCVSGQCDWDYDKGYIYKVDKDGNEIWTVFNGHNMTEAPIIADGKIIVPGDQGYITAYSLDGEQQWETRAEADSVTAPLAYSGDAMYVSTWSKLTSIDIPTGSINWQYGGLRSPGTPAIGSYVYFSDGGHLYALDKGNGGEIWKTYLNQDEQWYGAPPALGHGNVYIGVNGGVNATDYYVLDADDGGMVWSKEFNHFCAAGSAVGDDAVYTGESGQHEWFYKLSLDGTEEWHSTEPIDDTEGAPIITPDGMVLFSANRMYMLDSSDGSLVWSHGTSGWGHGPIADTDGFVYFTSTNGYLYKVGGTRSSVDLPSKKIYATRRML